jgi:uncharacterized protein (TIGR04551 family)
VPASSPPPNDRLTPSPSAAPAQPSVPASSPDSKAPNDRGELLPPVASPPPSAPPVAVPPRAFASPAALPAATPFLSIDPHQDQQQLAQQGHDRPTDGTIGADPRDVYSEDWWGRARPIFEIHGYFRTRGYLFHNFNLGRHDVAGTYTPNTGSLRNTGSQDQLWAPPIDTSLTSAIGGTLYASNLCGPNVGASGSGSGSGSGGAPCSDKSQSSANLRFRINPELSISDNLRVVSQLDLLNNLVLGSTSDAYAMQPSGTNPSGFASAGYNPYVPAAAFTTTQGSPTAGINSFQNAVNVNRVWAEYMTPVGQLRFGRMPNQWGLGMVNNAGDGIDSDYQSTIDRIMFVTGLKSWDLYAGGSWDFPATGPTNASPFDVYGGQPVNTCNLCNVEEWMLFVAHRTNPETQKMKLAHGDLVVNGGLQTTYKRQYLDIYSNGSTTYTPLTIVTNSSTAVSPNNNDLIRRDAYAFVPDAWVQGLWGKLRVEAEFAAILGDLGTLPGGTAYSQNPYLIQEFGLVTETEYRAVEDKLHLNFNFGWASGDPWVQGLNPGSNGLQPELNSTTQNPGTISTFRFHPDYRIDLIFFRNILTRVEGAYYFRPSVDYDFIRQANGQKLGGGVAVIWSRASQFEQDPGHARDLGLELDARIYYQAKDGSLNDDPSKLGGFYSMLQYGVFFPLAGLNYLPGEQQNSTALSDWSVSPAQTIQLFLGVVF